MPVLTSSNMPFCHAMVTYMHVNHHWGHISTPRGHPLCFVPYAKPLAVWPTMRPKLMTATKNFARSHMRSHAQMHRPSTAAMTLCLSAKQAVHVRGTGTAAGPGGRGRGGAACLPRCVITSLGSAAGSRRGARQWQRRRPWQGARARGDGAAGACGPDTRFPGGCRYIACRMALLGICGISSVPRHQPNLTNPCYDCVITPQPQASSLDRPLPET